MFPLSVVVLFLTIGLIARTTRLITADRILRLPRSWVVARLGFEHPVSYFVTCAWCVGVWVAGGIATLAWFYGEHPAYFIVALAGSASYLAGLSSTWLEPSPIDDEDQ